MILFKLTLAIAMAFAAISYVDGTAASAANRYSTGSDTDWFTAANWNTQADGDGSTGIHQANDDVFIQNTHEIIVDNLTASVDTVTVENGGMLSMASVGGGSPTTGILVVQESITVGSSTGIFRFNESTDAMPIVRADEGSTATPVTLDGPFTVALGQGGTFDRTSTNIFHLRTGSITSDSGPVTISAPIENDATIEAKGATDVTFSSTINVGSSGFFKVTAAGSDMTFNLSAAVTITGGADFLVTAGRMLFQQDVETDGGFKQTGGKTEVAAGKTFKATGAYP